MASPVWFVELLKRTFSQLMALARLTRLPVVGTVASHLLKHDRIVVVPRDRVIRIERSIEGIEHQVVPSQVLEHFIRSTPHRWVMETCICRASCNCKDYPIDLGCLFLGEAAEQINPALGRRVTLEQALEHVRRCQEAGLIHLVGRNRIDSIWLNVGPDHKLLTICSCCPCCCISRIVPHVDARIAQKVTRMPGLTVTVTADRCEGCGRCTSICFVDAISVGPGDRAEISDDCRGCGRCAAQCPNEAIELRIVDPAGVERAIARIEQAVDLS